MTRRFLWAVPRSMSTAFERWVIERGDHHVVDEPFSAVYYLGPERVSARFGNEEPDSTADRVLASVQAADQPTFVKDMVHHVPERLRPAVAELGRHTFLVRDPARAIPSFARVWPDVTWEECGYEAIARFGSMLDAEGIPHDVIDADDLQREPEGTLRSWCERHGLAFDADTLAWSPGPVPQWTRWLDFHARAMESEGLTPRPLGPLPQVDDPRIAGLVDRARPWYDQLTS